MSNKDKVIVLNRVLNYEDSAIKIYEEFCESKRKEIDVFLFNDYGINRIFEQPSDAVRTIQNHKLEIGEKTFIYRDDNDNVCFSDTITSKINIEEITEWLIEHDDVDTFDSMIVLTDLNLMYHMASYYAEKENDKKNYLFNFLDWLENKYMDTYYLLKSDWEKLNNDFQKEYYTNDLRNT